MYGNLQSLIAHQASAHHAFGWADFENEASPDTWRSTNNRLGMGKMATD